VRLVVDMHGEVREEGNRAHQSILASFSRKLPSGPLSDMKRNVMTKQGTARRALKAKR